MQTRDPGSSPASAPTSVPIGTKETQASPAVPQNATYVVATSTTTVSNETPAQQQQGQAGLQALPGLMAAIQAVPGNRSDRFVQAIFAIQVYPSTVVTSLKYSALSATRNIIHPFTNALEVDISHQSSSRASAMDKGFRTRAKLRVSRMEVGSRS